MLCEEGLENTISTFPGNTQWHWVLCSRQPMPFPLVRINLEQPPTPTPLLPVPFRFKPPNGLHYQPRLLGSVEHLSMPLHIARHKLVLMVIVPILMLKDPPSPSTRRGNGNTLKSFSTCP